MHPVRKLREAGPSTVAQNSELLAENVVFHSTVLIKAVEGREAVAAIPLSPALSASPSTAGTRFAARKSTNTLSLGARCRLDGHRTRRGPERSV